MSSEKNSPTNRILRFLLSERILHWVIAVPFLICLFTGLTVKLFFDRSDAELKDILMQVHKGAGIALIALPILTFLLRFKDRNVFIENIKVALHFTAEDIRWLMLSAKAAIDKTVQLPESPKFNSGEKLNFMMVTSTWPLFSITGLLMLITGTSGLLLWLPHVVLAYMALPVVMGHMFMALINPDTKTGLSGMFSGYVDAHWAQHHYGKWFREKFGSRTSD